MNESTVRQPLTAETAEALPRRVFAAAVFTGFVARLVALFGAGDRMLQQWPTEDGYLTLTIARNIAFGNGFSVGGGSIETNGTQPLATLLYSLGFALTSGDRAGGVRIALIMQLMISALSVWLLYDFTRRLFEGEKHREWIAALAASAWYLNPLMTAHSMNCLETGLLAAVALLVIKSWLDWLKAPASDQPNFARAAKLGVMMGVLAWSRVDSVFLMAALALVHLYRGFSKQQLRSALFEVTTMGGLAGAIISPWLISGKLKFGYWTPISGIAERVGAKFGENLYVIPSTLLEYVNGIVIVPGAFDGVLIGFALLMPIIGVWAFLVFRALRGAQEPVKYIALLGAVHALFLVGYYGFIFGAAHFVSRFLMPLSLYTFAFSAWLAVRFFAQRPALFSIGAGSIAACLLLLQQARLYRNGVPHPHWQVVEWVRDHVSDETWIGAVQTGTMGFYHDRTLNFDGKVDPRALKAVLEKKHHEYIVSSDAQYLIDWAGIAVLHEDGHVISDAFDKLVVDPAHNLGVLKRRGTTQ